MSCALISLFHQFNRDTASPLARSTGSSEAQAELGVFSNSWIRIYGFGSPHMLIRRYRRHQDCRDVEDIIARTFSPPDGPSGLIVYVGQRPEYVTSPFFLPFADHNPKSAGKRMLCVESDHAKIK